VTNIPLFRTPGLGSVVRRVRYFSDRPCALGAQREFAAKQTASRHRHVLMVTNGACGTAAGATVGTIRSYERLRAFDTSVAIGKSVTADNVWLAAKGTCGKCTWGVESAALSNISPKCRATQAALCSHHRARYRRLAAPRVVIAHFLALDVQPSSTLQASRCAASCHARRKTPNSGRRGRCNGVLKEARSARVGEEIGYSCGRHNGAKFAPKDGVSCFACILSRQFNLLFFITVAQFLDRR